MKEIECKGNWTASYAYEAICTKSKECNDIVVTRFANVVMRSDEPLSVFDKRLRMHLCECQKRFVEKQKDPKVKTSVIKNVLDNCVGMGYINEYASHRIMELINERI